jgi:ferredoxin-type protein NapH
MKIKPFRRSIQIAVFLIMFIVPVLNILEIYFIKGTFYSIDVGSAAMADPLAIFQAILSSKIINITMLASVTIPIFLMIFFGRIWCSFMCPYYLLVEGIDFIKKKLKLKSTKPKYSKELYFKTKLFRLIFLLFALFIAQVAGIPLLNLISAPGIISSQALVIVKFGYITFEAAFIVSLLILEFFFYRFWCRYFCPTGSFLSIIGIKRFLHVKKVKESCSMCKRCIAVCPMCINPMEDAHSISCINCGECVDACSDNKNVSTLKFRI